MGQEVVVNGERFYSLEDSPESSNTLFIITKYNLKTAKVNNVWQQDPNASAETTACSFCEYPRSFEWVGNDNLNESSGALAESTCAVYKAREYAKSVTGDNNNNTGRLLTITEFDAIVQVGNLSETKTAEEKAQIIKMIWGRENTQPNGSYLYFWLGTAGGPDHVYGVYGGYTNAGNLYFHLGGAGFGVRPVMTVPKTLVTLPQ